MDANRRTSLVVGGLFIAATVASLMGTAVEGPVASGAGDLAFTAGDMTRVAVGGLLELIAAATSVGIAIALYPLLRRWSTGAALGSVVFRAIEAVMYALAAVCLLAVATAGKPPTAAVADPASWQATGRAFLALRQEAVLAGVFAFAVGALLYYGILYRSRLVPRWLSGWGLVAELLVLVACLSALFSGSPVTTYAVIVLPIAVQEMVMAGWLIARGFSSEAVASGLAVRADADEGERSRPASTSTALRA